MTLYRLLLVCLSLLIFMLLGGCSSEVVEELPADGPLIISLTQLGDDFETASYGFYLANPNDDEMLRWHVLHPTTGTELVTNRCADAPLLIGRPETEDLLFKCADEYFSITLAGEIEQVTQEPFNSYLAETRLADAAKLQRELGYKVEDFVISPNQQRTFFYSLELNRNEYQLFMHKASSGEFISLLSIPADRTISHLKWSPDNINVGFLYTIQDNDPAQSLTLINTQSGELEIILPLVGLDDPNKQGTVDFDWSPDGSRLVFASDHEGSCEEQGDTGLSRCSRALYVANTTGSNVRRLNEEIELWALFSNDLSWVR